MTEMAPAVALLFDDTELVGQLREALQERGARIVHEGGVSSLSRELLQRVGVDVLVINLDDDADEAFDHLYEVIDGDHPRVVFNDAQASRTLEGWDRARWARHLAVKVLAAGDIDPPRPNDSRLIETSAAAVVAAGSPDAAAMLAESESASPSRTVVLTDSVPEESVIDGPLPVDAVAPLVDNTELAAPVDDALPDDAVVEREQSAAEESENLAAELEALLASGELPEEDEQSSGPGLRFVDGAEPPPLHDGNFGAPIITPETVDAAEPARVAPTPEAAGAAAPTFQLDHLELSSLTDSDVATMSPSAAHPLTPESVAPVRAPEGWALVDDDDMAATAEPSDKPSPAMFGIEKISAADYLAHDIEAVAPDLEPVMSLELVSMEEAIAPQVYVHDHEMVLNELGSALSRIVLLGAATEGVDAVKAFLAALPATTRLTFLHTQHLGDQSEPALLEAFQAHCALPVRLAEQNGRVGHGEVLMVPAGQQVSLRRDGKIELQAITDPAAESASIDASLTMAANVFGRDALAIVFGGRGNDAVAGAQAVHDRGGQVWVESSTDEYSADMVSGIFAERLVSFSGTPSELATRLIEVFP
ncbi:chemotaxis protein CheB [Rhodanobacter sp. AS-Z3]|uniref:chemotaxis protein CheB n=1 Tax=Rhodanobacter sp. AS-Z3 TaxID=3031330 RepID=UPI00247994BD|nr:chemotaxis protein CheB [Rhodanobacter sp. AS-Z3]WEN16290.1 chemotaxis protein CheB [Rhodanobacter sp. AS-Z3]